MPRKQRRHKARVDLPLTVAWHFTLLTGRLSGDTLDSCRLPGWTEQASDAVRDGAGNYAYDAVGDRLWDVHGSALTAEARAAGFEPFWTLKRAPTGQRFQEWRATFLSTHARRGPR